MEIYRMFACLFLFDTNLVTVLGSSPRSKETRLGFEILRNVLNNKNVVRVKFKSFNIQF